MDQNNWYLFHVILHCLQAHNILRTRIDKSFIDVLHNRLYKFMQNGIQMVGQQKKIYEEIVAHYISWISNVSILRIFLIRIK